MVEQVAGVEQSYQTGKQKLEPFALAWLEPYLRHQPDAAAEALAEKYRPLAHAKLGGNLTRIGDWIARLPATAG